MLKLLFNNPWPLPNRPDKAPVPSCFSVTGFTGMAVEALGLEGPGVNLTLSFPHCSKLEKPLHKTQAFEPLGLLWMSRSDIPTIRT